jgi:hypothetical protein
MIWVPRPKDFPELEIANSQSLAGWFKFEVLKVDSSGRPIEASRRVVADWFPNIILDQGLNRMGTQNSNASACQVGTGTSTPIATQTSLDNRIAGTTTIQSSVESAQAASPFYRARTNIYRFAVGTATGTLSEVGVGWSATLGGSLFSRALILTAGGSPTTITVLADEALDVTYQCRLYYSETDAFYNVTVTGVGTLNVTARAARIGSSTNWDIGMAGLWNTPSGTTAHNGAIGAITAQPSGASSGASSVTLNTYSNNSLQLTGSVIWGLNNGNLAGGILSVSPRFGNLSGSWGEMQYQFSSAINKLNTQVLTLNFQHTWARRP